MYKLKRKFILIGIVSIVVIAMVAVFAVPAMAAGWPLSSPRDGGNNNITRVQGTIDSIDASEIVITTTGSNGSTTQVTLALDTSTNFSIHGNGWFDYTSLDGDSVVATYNSSQTANPPVASQVVINMPSPSLSASGTFENHDLSAIQGTLSGSGTSFTVTENTTTTQVNLTAADGQTVTIIYNANNSNTIKGLILNSSGQAPSTPNNRNNSFATVQGTLSGSDATSFTISETTTPAVDLSVTSGQLVTILYDSNNTIQGLMLNRSGQFSFTPNSLPNRNTNSIQGTLAVGAGDILTITPSTTPSITLTVPSNQIVTVLYNTSTGTVQRVVLNRSGQNTSTPSNLPANMAAVQGTLAVGAGDVLTITPSTTPSITLVPPSNTEVAVIYNPNSNNVIQGLMLGGPEQFPFTPNNLPNNNGMNRFGPGRSGPFGFSSQ